MYNVNGWKDQLSRIDITHEVEQSNGTCTCTCMQTDSESCSYNALGKPTSYRGNTVTWNTANRMSRYGSTTFTYDANGVRLTKGSVKYYYDGDKLLREEHPGYALTYFYGIDGIIGFTDSTQKNCAFFYRKNLQGDVTELMCYDYNSGEITKHASYIYDAYGNCRVLDEFGVEDSCYGDVNPIRYRGYYYDTETGLYLIQGRYYDPEIGRFIEPAKVSHLNPSDINGLNLYCYANNVPIEIVYSNSAVVSENSGRMVEASVVSDSFRGSIRSNIASNKALILGLFADMIENYSTINGLYASISGLVNHTIFFTNYLRELAPINVFSDDMTMIGASMKNGVLSFNQFTWKFGKGDVVSVAVGVGLDVYDSIQRGVSASGILLGATLTATKGIGLIYLNKGIMYGATAVGSAICPGVGTVVGFIVGGAICILVDIFANNWLDNLINKIAK